MGVSRSGYYNWRKRPQSRRERDNNQLLTEIRRIHRGAKMVYGSPRIHSELIALGMSCSENRVARLMREQGIRSKRGRRFRRPGMKSVSSFDAPNLLRGDFQAKRANQIWLADLTWVSTSEGWLFLAVVMDLFSRRIVGWSMSHRATHDVALNALQMALAKRNPPPGCLVHHSDRGIHYTCNAYQNLLHSRQIEVSVSRKANCYDNAVIESFFASLKMERVFHQRYHRREEAELDLFNYIEVFYNRRRRHSSLGNRSPDEFESLTRVSSASVQ